MPKRDYHVTPHPDGGWQVRREGADRASSRHDTQGEALERGRELAQQERAELVIHRRDGTIRDSDSFGRDPNPPTDQKH
jgi:uncharacterized protein YdaT